MSESKVFPNQSFKEQKAKNEISEIYRKMLFLIP